MPDSSSQEYDEDEEEPESEELADATSHSEEDDEEEELCSLAGSPRDSFDGRNHDEVQDVLPAGTSSRNRITNKARVQCHETFVPGNPSMPARPMMEQDAGSNIWYQAYVLRESMNEVKVSFPPYDSDDEERIEWVRKSSSRIWRGSYRNSQWKHLGRGAWTPKTQPKRGRRRPTSSKQARKRNSSRLQTTDTSADGDTRNTGTVADDVEMAGTATNLCPHASVGKSAYADCGRSRVAEQARPNNTKRVNSSEHPADEEHSERGNVEHRDSRDCHSGGLDTSNKENCDRTSAKSNPSEYKGIFSCSEPEDQDAECSMDQAEYDPLTKWFEVHFQQLQLHGKIPRFFPHGTPEAGVLPPGFEWGSNGIAFTDAASTKQGSNTLKSEAAAIGHEEAAIQLAQQDSSPKLDCNMSTGQFPSPTNQAAEERAAKLRKLHDGSCADSRGAIHESSCASPVHRNSQNCKHHHVSPLDFHTTDPVPPSPVMSPNTSTGGAAMIIADGTVILNLPGKSPDHPSPQRLPSPARKDCMMPSDVPPGGSSQSESDFLHEKDHPRSSSAPSNVHTSPCTDYSPAQKFMPTSGANNVSGRSRAQSGGSFPSKVKRKRAVIVSDDEEEDAGDVNAGLHPKRVPVHIPKADACMSAPSSSQPAVTHPRNIVSSDSQKVATPSLGAASKGWAGNGGANGWSDSKALSASGKVVSKPTHTSGALVKPLARKPPAVSAVGKGRVVDTTCTNRAVFASRTSATVRKPSLVTNSRAQSVQSVAALMDDCPTITRKAPNTPSADRMLPHKKALLAGKSMYSSR